jgi:hypothetical protein
MKFGLNVVLITVYYHKNCQVKIFLRFKMVAIYKLKKNYLFQTYFELKLLNGCHFEIKKAFDLKMFMMIDPNKNNI